MTCHSFMQYARAHHAHAQFAVLQFEVREVQRFRERGGGTHGRLVDAAEQRAHAATAARAACTASS